MHHKINAYQKHLGSLTVSFNLQETTTHTLELGSDCCVAFLDASKHSTLFGTTIFFFFKTLSFWDQRQSAAGDY